MLDLFFNFIDFIYNNYFYYYSIYRIIYENNLYIKFHIQYLSNIIKYYITFNKLVINILRPLFFLYYHIRRIFLWLNRRFIKKRKRFRLYYRYHNVRY